MPLDFFLKTSLPDRLPSEMDNLIQEIKKLQTKEECLQKIYNFLISKYRGSRIKTVTRIPELFKKDVNFLWYREGFLHCTNINYILRIFLIKSGFFSEKDIYLKWTFIWYCAPHQYLRVNIEDNWINIDVWAYIYGIEYNNYASGFNQYLVPKK